MKWLAALALLAWLSVSCSSGPPGNSGSRVQILVSAAASLADVFGEIEQEFETENPGIELVLNFSASSALREQILEGAPVDVFASANAANMDQLVEAGEVAGEPRIFGRNRLEIAVPAGNPAGVIGLQDFSRPELLIGLCAQGTPCGDFARRALQNAAVSPAVDTNEPDVRALLTKIGAGELDAGITYVTDVTSAGGSVDGIEIPQDLNVIAEYPIAVLSNAPNPQWAQTFVEFVLSAAGQTILAKYGFMSP